MKKYIAIYSLILALSASFISCEDFLETTSESSITEDKLFSNPSFANSHILGIYDILGENRSYRKHLTVYLGLNTDIEMHTNSVKEIGTTHTGDRKTMAVYDMRASDANDGFNDKDGKDPFSRIYTGIERANLAISGIRQYGDTVNNTQYRFLLGEALTLRAFFYNDLTKIWGDVPLRIAPVTGETAYVGATDRDQIYEQIIADLRIAEELVPWAGEATQTNTVCRVNKSFVKALKARICLMYAGYSLRSPEVAAVEVKKTFANGKIARTVSDEKRAELYAEARQACLDVMGGGVNASGQGFSLEETSFEKIFKDQCKDNISVGRESIFELPFLDGARGEYVSYLGLRHEFDKTKSDPFATTAVKGEVGVVPSFFYDFDEDDTRRDVTACPYKWIDGTLRLVSNPRTFYLGKWRAEWMNRVVGSNDDGVNFCVIRYADVVLMFAETENELNGATADAQSALKLIRNRAFQGNAKADKVFLNSGGTDITALSKEDFFKAIVDERAFEFCGENIRKWDLMRWGLLGDKMNEAVENMRDLGKVGEGTNYKDVNDVIYWKWDNGDSTKIVIHGFKAAENADPIGYEGNPESTSDAILLLPHLREGKWVKKGSNTGGWITGTTGEGANEKKYFDDEFNTSLFKNDPDERQLFPITNVILTNMQGTLSNKYGY